MNKWLVQHINLFDNTVDSRFIETTKHAQGALAEFMCVPVEEYKEFRDDYKLVSNGMGSEGFHAFVEGEVVTVTLV